MIDGFQKSGDQEHTDIGFQQASNAKPLDEDFFLILIFNWKIVTLKCAGFCHTKT